MQSKALQTALSADKACAQCRRHSSQHIVMRHVSGCVAAHICAGRIASFDYVLDLHCDAIADCTPNHLAFSSKLVQQATMLHGIHDKNTSRQPSGILRFVPLC